MVEHVRRRLTDLLDLRGCRFEYGTLMGRPPRLEQDGTIAVGRRARDPEAGGWPDGEIELCA